MQSGHRPAEQAHPSLLLTDCVAPAGSVLSSHTLLHSRHWQLPEPSALATESPGWLPNLSQCVHEHASLPDAAYQGFSAQNGACLPCKLWPLGPRRLQGACGNQPRPVRTAVAAPCFVVCGVLHPSAITTVLVLPAVQAFSRLQIRGP